MLRAQPQPAIIGYRINDTCIACGNCMYECPVEAISEGDTIYEIDSNQCVACGNCVGVCPIEAIKPIYESDVPKQIVISGKVTILSGQPVLKSVNLTQRAATAGSTESTLVASTPISGSSYSITLPLSFQPDPAMIYELKVVGVDCMQTDSNGVEILLGQQITLKAGGQYEQDLYVKYYSDTYNVRVTAIGDLRSRASVTLTLPSGPAKMSLSVDSPYLIVLKENEFSDGEIAHIEGVIWLNNKKTVGTANVILRYGTYEYTAALRMSGITPTDPFNPSGPEIFPGT